MKKMFHKSWWRENAGPLLFILGGSACALLIVSVTAHIELNRATTHTVCQRIHTLDVTVQAILKTTVTTDGQLAQVSTFLRQHPEIRAKILQENLSRKERWLKLLQNADCKPPY